ncbi:hypothetical protein AV530_001971 [Patagioenas fasciata monilis]|uniref:Uncharacterized protein n=1 Tax=Patagioenas fasciata monilis TaxID=372326 RepID=A0A1V4J6J2_PATFA|nr:hypothetical protein AV530_001971 [Patagioenas fasciata monilis]
MGWCFPDGADVIQRRFRFGQRVSREPRAAQGLSGLTGACAGLDPHGPWAEGRRRRVIMKGVWLTELQTEAQLVHRTVW